MEKAGVITRTTADDDRRGMEIAVTDAGRVALLAAIESHLDLVASLFTDRLTTTDRTAMNRVLAKLLDTSEPDSGASQGKPAGGRPERGASGLSFRRLRPEASRAITGRRGANPDSCSCLRQQVKSG